MQSVGHRIKQHLSLPSDTPIKLPESPSTELKSAEKPCCKLEQIRPFLTPEATFDQRSWSPYRGMLIAVAQMYVLWL